jgi:hypothetical protein
MHVGQREPEAAIALEQYLGTLWDAAPELGAVAFTTIVNPAAGISLAIQKIAKRVRRRMTK